MSAVHRSLTESSDQWIAVLAVAATGFGALLVLYGTLSGQIAAAAAGGALGGAGLILLVVGGWVDGLIIVALSFPLPALFSNDEIRITAAALVTAAVVLAWALGLAYSRHAVALGRFPVKATVVLVGVFVVATLLGQSPVTSARETLNFVVLLALLVVATDLFMRDPDRMERILAVLVWIAALCGVLALLETLRILPGEFVRFETRFNRAALGFGQPNGLGLFLAVMIPLAAYRYGRARTRIARALYAFAAGALIIGLAGTFSRGSWFAVLAGSGVFLLSRDWRLAGRIWLVAVVCVVVLDLGSGGALRDTVLRTLGDWVLEQRLALMLAGVLMFLEHPIIGVGPGGFAENLDRFAAQVSQLWDIQPTPHNAYIQMAAETGVIGLVAFVAFLTVTLWALLKEVRRSGRETGQRHRLDLRRALLWSFATVCVAGLVVWPFAHGPGQLVMLVAAMAYVLPRESAAELDAGEAAEPDAAEPDAAEPDAAEPDAAEPDAAEPDVAEPDTADPEVAEPDATEPDAAEPDVDTKENPEAES